MVVFFTFLALAIVVGTVGGLGLFFVERWLERRAAKRQADNELLAINEELSDTQGTPTAEQMEQQVAAAVVDTTFNNLN